MSVESVQDRLIEKYYQLKYAFFYKGKSGLYEELKDYTFMTKDDLYAVRNVSKNKGLTWYSKMKSVLRKSGVNGS